ncbi:MAG: hypothetical protein ACHP7J_02655 [Terriglobales bacterium]
MATPPVSNLSIFQEIQSFYQNRGADLRQLGSALQSGDLNAAQQAYNTLASLGQGGPFANSEPFVRADRAKDFEAVGQALQSGDLAGAQAAFAALQHSSHSRNQSTSGLNLPAVVVTLSGAAQATSAAEPIYQQLQQFRTDRKGDIGQLGKDLQSGDLQAAQQAYDALVALGKNGPFGNSLPFQRADRAQDFTAIGKALQSGDLAGAQQAFAALASTFGHPDNHGGPLPPIFINVYENANPGPVGPPTPAPQPVGPPAVQPPATLPPKPPPLPIGPPAVQPPATLPPKPPPLPIGPPAVQPPSTKPPSTLSEIVINIGGSSSPAPPSGPGPELVLNLPSASGPNATAEEVQINFGGSNGSGGHLNIDVSPIQGKQGSSGEEISINFGAGAANPEVVLNLFDAGTGSSNSPVTQSQGNSLNVKA